MTHLVWFAHRLACLVLVFLAATAFAVPSGSPEKAESLRRHALDVASKAVHTKSVVPNTNDNCASAFAITSGTWTGDTSFTSATDDGISYCEGTRDVWFVLSVPSSGRWSIANYGPIDGVISLHSACPGTPENELACDDDYSLDLISLDLTAGVPYYLRLAGYEGAVGVYALRVWPTTTLNNGLLELSIDEHGNFTLGQLPNASSTENWLLYGHPQPWSGATTLRVDGTDFWNYNGQSLGTQTYGPTKLGNQCVTTWQAGGVELTQVIEFKRGITSLVEDTAELRYVLRNVSSQVHTAGLRLFLDTYLGQNDGAPFRVPGLGEVTSERELYAPNIPQYWTAFDNLKSPHKTAQGSLIASNGELPDRVVWGAWAYMNDSRWDYTINPAQLVTSDSAVYIFYDPELLQPGATREFVTYYGLSGINIDYTAPLAVGLNCVEEMTMEQDRYSPNPFLVTAYIENSLAGVTVDAEGVSAELQLPSQMRLVSGAARQELGTISRNGNSQLSWYVQMLPNVAPPGPLPPDPDHFTLTLHVGTTNMGGKDVARTIAVPKLRNAAPGWGSYQ